MIDELTKRYEETIATWLNLPFSHIVQSSLDSTLGSGMVFQKRNSPPPEGVEEKQIGEHWLPLKGRVLHERVFLLTSTMQKRSYREASHEVVVNIGDTPITYMGDWETRKPLAPGQSLVSLETRGAAKTGYSHGYEINGHGLIYTARALFPKFANGSYISVLPAK